MSGDLIDTVESLLQSRLGKRAAEALGVPAASIQAALRLVAPTIMAGVAEQCASVDQADDLLTTLRGARKADPSGDDLIKLLVERAPHVGARAPTFLSQLLFGAHEDAVVEAIAASSTLETRPVSHLLEICIMASFSLLRDHAREEGWDGARMRQALQLERMLIKMELDREVARATGFDWLASDDPRALFTTNQAAPPASGQDPSGVSSTGKSNTAVESSGDTSTRGSDAASRPRDSAPRSRKSIVDLLHARMAQGALPSAAPPSASPLNAGAAAGNSVYAQRRLDEWLDPARKAALDAATAASAVNMRPTEIAEPGPPITASTGELAAPNADTTAEQSVAPDSDDEPVREVHLGISTAIELEQTWPRNPVIASALGNAARRPVDSDPPHAAAEHALQQAAPSPNVDITAPIAAVPTAESAPADRVPADPADELDFEKTMPLPFDPARHLASSHWPFSIFACRDPIYLEAPESYATRLPSDGARPRAASTQESLASSTIAPESAPLAQSDLTLRSSEPERAAANKSAPAITRPAIPSPTIFSDEVASDPKPHPTKSISNWWLGPVVIVAAVVALIILSYRITGQRSAPEPTPPAQAPTKQSATEPASVPAAPTGVPSVQHEAKLGAATAFSTVKLPGGAQLNVRSNGFIASLASTLGDAGTGAGAGQRFVMDEISFDRDTAMLAPGSDAQLRQLTEVLDAFPNAKIRIEGHTDRDGDTAVIRALSADRAASVKASLIMNGISEERVQSQGFGADKPLSTSTSAQERAQNRRVEIVIVER